MQYYNNQFLPSESEIKQNLQRFEEAINEEDNNDKPDEDKILKLMNQQLLQGLYLQTL